MAFLVSDVFILVPFLVPVYKFDIHATATPQFPEVPAQAAGKAVEAMISLGAQLVLGMFLGVLKPQMQIATVSCPYLGP